MESKIMMNDPEITSDQPVSSEAPPRASEPVRRPFYSYSSPYPQLGEEAVLAADPQVIFATQHGSDLQHWLKWPQLAAVKNKQLYLLKADWLHRLSPRIVLGIEQMCSKVEMTSKAQANSLQAIN
jgi:vitamin B12 transport system substrate-binding protein